MLKKYYQITAETMMLGSINYDLGRFLSVLKKLSQKSCFLSNQKPDN